jgi:transposase
LDIAKRVFQVHGVDAAGKVVVRRQLRRSEVVRFFAKLAPCLVGLEACATAHYWGREIAVLGHCVRLMPPTRVKPYSLPRRRPGSNGAARTTWSMRRPVARR